MSLDKYLSQIEDFNIEKDLGKDLISLIKNNEVALAKFEEAIRAINAIREKQDPLLVEYIENIVQPEELDSELITYKALFLYFRKTFIQNRRILKLTSFSKNGARGHQIQILKNFFEDTGEIHIDVKDTNFPHLIGYKNSLKDEYGQWDKNHNIEFLDKVFYEINLIEDYKEHNCSLSKMKCISWISETLNRPTWVLDKECLTERTKISTDLLFIKKAKISNDKFSYHYVSLIKERPRESILNKYIINSHHKIEKSDIIGKNMKFDIRKAIYKYDFRKK
jgi:hypothetical protein